MRFFGRLFGKSESKPGSIVKSMETAKAAQANAPAAAEALTKKVAMSMTDLPTVSKLILDVEAFFNTNTPANLSRLTSRESKLRKNLLKLLDNIMYTIEQLMKQGGLSAQDREKLKKAKNRFKRKENQLIASEAN